jgi:DNA mismatch repair protein PMS2
MPKKMKIVLNEIYKEYNTSMSPIIILSLLVEDDNYDINASPDKREVFLKNEKEVIEGFRCHLVDFFEKI